MKRLRAFAWILCLIGVSLGCLNSVATTDGTESTTTLSTTEATVYEERGPGQLDELLKVMARFNEKFADNPQLNIHTETDVTVYNARYGLVRTSTFDMAFDVSDFYLFYSMNLDDSYHNELGYLFEKDGQILQYRNDSDNQIIESVVLPEITSEGMITLLEGYGLTNEGDLSYFREVQKVSSTVYRAKVGYPDWGRFLGFEFAKLMNKIDGIDQNEAYIDIEIVFHPLLTKYDMNVELTVVGSIEGNYIKFEMAIDQEVRIEEIDKMSVAEMGFNIPVSPTAEDIRFDATISRSIHYKVDPDKDNWVRYYLEPGYYIIKVAGSSEADISIHNEDMESIPHEDPFHVEEPGYFYINIHPAGTEPTTVGLNINDLHLNDISTTVVEGINPGSISGYSEGPTDINKLIFPATDREYILVMGFNFGGVPQAHWDWSLSPDYVCNTSMDHCPYLVSSAGDLEIQIHSDHPGSFLLQYKFVEFAPTSQDPNFFEDISSYNEDHPMQLGRGADFAYFTITIDHYGKYSIFFTPVYGRADYITYDMYTMDGVPLTLGGMNGDFLAAGTYVVKLYHEYGVRFDVFYPYLHEWD